MKRFTQLFAVLLGVGALPGAEVPTVINVEVDYMVDGTHSHEPPQLVLDALVQMFACQGITLNLLVDDVIPHEDVIQCDDLSQPFWTCPGATSFATLESTYRDTGAGWHYCIIAHQYATSTGVTSSSGRSNGLDSFIVTLGGLSGTDFQVAATFAHELGHDLGLGHVAPLSTPGARQYSPNYASVMCYEFQLNGVKDRLESRGVVGADHLFKNLDYSHGRLPSLWEPSLMEPDGVGIVPIDWDCSGAIQAAPVWTELDAQSGWCTANVGSNRLYDRNDWADIEDDTDAVSRLTAQTKDWICADREDFDRIGALDNARAATLEVEPCTSADMFWLDTAGLAFGSGTGEYPISSLGLAAAGAPAGSILYLQPGTFTNGGGSMLFTKRVLFAGIGGLIDP